MADQLNPTMLQKLAALLGGQQAGQNVQTAQNPAYVTYARTAQAMGEPVLPMQAWIQQQQAARAATPPQPVQQVQPAEPKPFQF
jgi:hypothetical protein